MALILFLMTSLRRLAAAPVQIREIHFTVLVQERDDGARADLHHRHDDDRRGEKRSRHDSTIVTIR